MQLEELERRVVAGLSRQVRPPAGWEVVADVSLEAGWLGRLPVSLAVLSPGPGGAACHRAQLVVFVGPFGGDAAASVAERIALAAAADVPEAWWIDRSEARSEVYRAPFDGRYRSRTLVYPGEVVVPLALNRLRVVPLPRRCVR